MNELLGRDPDPLWLAIAWAALLGALLLVAFLAWRNRPRQPATGPATMELRPETPAIVDLLTGDFRVTPEAVPATLLDLAARRWVELEQVGEGTVLRVPSGEGEGALTPYEQRVLRHVRGLAQDGIVPAHALTTGPEDVSDRWWRRFRKDVIADAQGRGLCVKRWRLGQLALMWGGIVVSGILLRVALAVGDPRGTAVGPAERRLEAADLNTPATYAFLLGGLVFLGLVWLAVRYSRSQQQRDTDAGLAAAAHWMGVRKQLSEQGEFSDKPAASVVLWERYLGYAAAMDLAPIAVRQLPLGAEDDRRAWSRATGGWRKVRVVYPKLRPAWGRHPLQALLVSAVRGAIAGAIVWFAVRAAAGEIEQVRDLDAEVQTWIARIGPIVAVVLLPVVLWQVVTFLMALVDLFGRREVTGVLLRKRVIASGDWLPKPLRWLWRRRTDPDTGMRVQVKRRHYLAVDTGKRDRIPAWRVKPEVYGRAPAQLAEVRARATPLLGHVKSVEMTTPPPVRDKPASMVEMMEEAAGPAGALVEPALDKLTGQMDRLEGMTDEEGRPLLDHTDEKGVPLRQRLEEARKMLRKVKGEDTPET